MEPMIWGKAERPKAGTKRLKLMEHSNGYVLRWGGVEIRISIEEWEELIIQAMKIEEERRGW